MLGKNKTFNVELVYPTREELVRSGGARTDTYTRSIITYVFLINISISLEPINEEQEMRFGRTPTPDATASSDSEVPTPTKTLWGFVRYLISEPQEEIDPEPSISPVPIDLTVGMSKRGDDNIKLSSFIEKESPSADVPTSTFISSSGIQDVRELDVHDHSGDPQTVKPDERDSGTPQLNSWQDNDIKELEQSASQSPDAITSSDKLPVEHDIDPLESSLPHPDVSETEVTVGSTYEGPQTPKRNSYDARSVFVSAFSVIDIPESAESSEATVEEVEDLDASNELNTAQPFVRQLNVAPDDSVYKFIDNRDTYSASSLDILTRTSPPSAIDENPTCQISLDARQELMQSVIYVAKDSDFGSSTRSGEVTDVHNSLDSMDQMGGGGTGHTWSNGPTCRLCGRIFNLQDNSRRRRFSI